MMDDLISRREAIKVVRASCHWDYHWASKSPNDIMSDAVNALKGLPSAQPEYEPVTLEDFARTMSEITVWGFAAWQGWALALIKDQGFVICKKMM